MSGERQIFTRSVRLPVSAAKAFAWHERPGAFLRLTPPWERVELESHVGGLRDGAVVKLRAKAGPAWTRWEVEHRDYAPGKLFRDVARKSPFAHWDHRHEFVDTPDGGCELTDRATHLESGGQDWEQHRVFCQDGTQILVQCRYGDCTTRP